MKCIHSLKRTHRIHASDRQPADINLSSLSGRVQYALVGVCACVRAYLCVRLCVSECNHAFARTTTACTCAQLRACTSACANACMRACVSPGIRKSMRAQVRPSVRAGACKSRLAHVHTCACVRKLLCVCVCMHAQVHARICPCACVGACVHACVHKSVCACARVRLARFILLWSVA